MKTTPQPQASEEHPSWCDTAECYLSDGPGSPVCHVRSYVTEARDRLRVMQIADEPPVLELEGDYFRDNWPALTRAIVDAYIATGKPQ